MLTTEKLGATAITARLSELKKATPPVQLKLEDINFPAFRAQLEEEPAAPSASGSQPKRPSDSFVSPDSGKRPKSRAGVMSWICGGST